MLFLPPSLSVATETNLRPAADAAASPGGGSLSLSLSQWLPWRAAQDR